MSTFNQTQFIANSLKLHQEQPLNSKERSPVRLSRRDSLQQAESRLSQAGVSDGIKHRLLSPAAREDFPAYTANIENYIGTVSIPVGMAGPLSIKGSYANGDYYIPLATTEAALVASYNRGLNVIKQAGGCTSMVLDNAVQRAPCFAFDRLIDSAKFCIWIDAHFSDIKTIAEQTTNYGNLRHIEYLTESNFVMLVFHFSTGIAAGQNMVTLATDAAYQYILKHCPVKPCFHALEANASGEKKTTLRSMMGVRGYKVTAEIRVPCSVFERELQISVTDYMNYYRLTRDAAVVSVNLNPNAHFANAIAAIFIACGQDAACIAEAATGFSKVIHNDSNYIYISATLSNLIVGTIGGGTQLPHQQACLELMQLHHRENTAAEFAEIIAGVCLAGDISLSAALAKGDFARAHHVLARKRKKHVLKKTPEMA